MMALDLFCGAGGAAMGLHRAGFEVVGIDLRPQPRFPFAFIQADALRPPVRLEDFDLIWASPPCQAFCAYQRTGRVGPTKNLIPQTRAMLRAADASYVIENVLGAPLYLPFMLCGSSFGLDVRRHRIFEASFEVILTPPCWHGRGARRFKPSSDRKNLRRTIEVGAWDESLADQSEAMGIDWMTVPELSQAIPPAYSEFIAKVFLAQRAREAA